MRGISGEVAAQRLQDVERGTDRGVADRVDRRRDAARGRTLGPLAEAVRRRSSRRRDVAPAGSGRSASVSMSSSSAAVRDPSEPSAKHFCQPTVARPSGFGAETRAASMAALDGRRDGVVAHARMDAQRQPAGIGRGGHRPGTSTAGPGPGRRRPDRGRRRRRAGRGPARPRSGPRRARRRSGRDVDRHEAARRLVEHALGRRRCAAHRGSAG